MNWLEKLTGFNEGSPQQVRNNLIVDGAKWRSLANGKIFTCGRLKTLSLGELKVMVILE